MRVYLGGPMFAAAEVAYNLRLARTLRAHGFEVYCPNESEPINDKTRTDLTGQAIYLADIDALEQANVFICQVSEDSGTNWEAGYMDCLARHVNRIGTSASLGWRPTSVCGRLPTRRRPDPTTRPATSIRSWSAVCNARLASISTRTR